MMNLVNSEFNRAGEGTSRRGFLIGAAATAGGLVIGFGDGAFAAAPAETKKPAAPVSPFAAYLEIGADNQVTVLSSQFDMGQGSYHGVATLVVEELGADWDQVTVVGASANTALYGNIMWGGVAQGTGGSTTIATSFERYRKAGATARAMLVAAAAEAWQVPAGEIAVAAGMLSHPSGKKATFGAMAAMAAKQPIPENVPLKSHDQWTEIGSETRRRFDTAPKTDGTHDFTIDIKLPGMLTAVMIHPPRFGATVQSFEAAEAKAMPGVVDVVAVPRGVAVVAEHMWAALKARDAVRVTWDESKAEKRGSAGLLDEFERLSKEPPALKAASKGDAAGAMAKADKVVEATYRFPYLAHAAMEPLNAVARMNADGTLEVWGGLQIPDLYIHVAAATAGVEKEKVRLHVMKTGGGFGRRGVGDGDIVNEAVSVAKAIGFKAPVKVQWTRENDMQGGRYRPAYVHRMKAGVDKDGTIAAWEHHIVGQSIVAGTPFQGMIQDGVDPTSVEGAANLPYALSNMDVGLTTMEVGIPVLWWRSVGSTHTAYSTETFLDEVAAAAGRDPLALRLELLKDHPRHAGVLKLAAEKAGWGKPVAAGRALGLAVHESFASYVAQVAEVSIVDGMPRVHRVVCAVDCGIPVNPDVIRAQVEGSIGFGLGAILAENLTLTDGVVDQGNYDTYTPLRIDAMPDVEVHIVASTESPTGIGEPGVPPIGPAVANAVFKLTGSMRRTLPFAES